MCRLQEGGTHCTGPLLLRVQVWMLVSADMSFSNFPAQWLLLLGSSGVTPSSCVELLPTAAEMGTTCSEYRNIE